jgi:hypothetical protein
MPTEKPRLERLREALDRAKLLPHVFVRDSMSRHSLHTVSIAGLTHNLEEGTKRQKLGDVDFEPMLAGCRRCRVLALPAYGVSEASRRAEQ